MQRVLIGGGVVLGLGLLAGLAWLALSATPVDPPERSRQTEPATVGAAEPDDVAATDAPRRAEVPPEDEQRHPQPPPPPERPVSQTPATPTRTRVRVPVTRPVVPAATDSVGLARAFLNLRLQARRSADPAEAEALGAAAAELEIKLAPFVGALVRSSVGRAEAFAVLSADAALEERFAEPDDAAVLDGTRWKPETGLPEHVVLRFPKGVHHFSANDVLASNPPPKTIVIEGAGMDQTALVGWERWNAPKESPRWTFRDCTVHCSGNEFVHGGGPAEFRLERVRVVGCGTGGGSQMFDAAGLVVAVGCRFEEGVDESSGINLFQGSRLSVRLDDCTFVGPFNHFSRAESLVATECRFEWAPKGFVTVFERSVAQRAAAEEAGSTPKLPTMFIDCSIDSVWDGKRWPKRTLADINADWAPDR